MAKFALMTGTTRSHVGLNPEPVSGTSGFRARLQSSIYTGMLTLSFAAIWQYLISSVRREALHGREVAGLTVHFNHALLGIEIHRARLRGGMSKVVFEAPNPIRQRLRIRLSDVLHDLLPGHADAHATREQLRRSRSSSRDADHQHGACGPNATTQSAHRIPPDVGILHNPRGPHSQVNAQA